MPLIGVTAVFEWLSANPAKAEQIYTVLGKTDLIEVAAEVERLGVTTMDMAYTKLVGATTISAERQCCILASRKLLKQEPLTLFHGNKDPDMVPVYGKGRKNNDFGLGFYMTPSKELGKEWAYADYTKGEVGYVHTLSLPLTGLKVLNLVEYDTLHWVAELYAHRKLKLNPGNDSTEIIQDRVSKFISKYKLDTSGYDVIIGYRADDSYFSYANDFAMGLLYKETLDKAMLLGDLGLQVAILSKRAFDTIQPLSVEEVDKKYAKYYADRDAKARADYQRKKKNPGKKLITDYI